LPAISSLRSNLLGWVSPLAGCASEEYFYYKQLFRIVGLARRLQSRSVEDFVGVEPNCITNSFHYWSDGLQCSIKLQQPWPLLKACNVSNQPSTISGKRCKNPGC